MQATINNSTIFGVPIYEIDIPDFSKHREKLAKKIIALSESDQGIKATNSGGWHSSRNLHSSDDVEVQWLIQQIYQFSSECIKHSRTMPDPKADIVLSSFWANINNFGDWNVPHAHFTDDWSGVCYIQINEQDPETRKSNEDGNIFFFNPLMLGPQYQRWATINYRPKNGKLMLFPSYMVHMVAPHFDNAPRISVSFNFKFK